MAFMAHLRTAAGESPLALRLRFNVVAAARAAEVDARRGGFGGRSGAARPKRRFVNLGAVSVKGQRAINSAHCRQGAWEEIGVAGDARYRPLSPLAFSGAFAGHG